MRRLVFVFLAALFPIACIVRADVGDIDGPDSGAPDDPEDASATDTTAPSKDAGNTSDVDANDAGNLDPIVDAGCGVTFAQQADFIDVQVVQGSTPSLKGGSFTPGIYALVAMRGYGSDKSGTMQVRETMRVRGSATNGAFDRLTEARNATGSFEAYPLHGETIVWDVLGGTSYFETMECPKSFGDKSARFEASEDTLTLFDNADWIERVYQRLP